MLSSKDTAANSDEVQRITQVLSGIEAQAIADGFQKMVSTKKHKLSFALGGKSASIETGALTIRFTPEMQKKWLQLATDFTAQKTTLTADVHVRLSGEFAAAFKNGECIIEVKENDQRICYAIKEIAQKLREGKLQLSHKNGETVDYHAVKVIESKEFEALADALISQMKTAKAPQATVASTQLASEAKQAATATPPPPQATVKQGEKSVPLPPKREKTESKETEALKSEEKAIEKERDNLRHKVKEAKEEIKHEEKVKDTETRKEAIKEEAVNADVETIDAKVEDESSASEDAT